MAACTFRVGTADTGATPNTSGAFTPAVGDLLVVLFSASSTASNAWTVSSSVGGFTFTQIAAATANSSTDRIFCYVSNALVASATSQTVTVGNAADEGNGSVIFVYSVSGMSQAGAAAVRQSKTAPGPIAAGTPAPVFTSACLTGNPTFGLVCNASAAPIITPPTGWTEPATGDLSYITPPQGAAVCHRNSGFTGTTVTWGSASATGYGALLVELDSSVLLTTDSAGHAHTADAPVLVARYSIAPDNVTHTHPATAPATPVAGFTVAPASGEHASEAGSPDLQLPAGAVTPASSGHTHEAGGPVLVAGYSIAPASVIHTHEAGEPSLAADFGVAPDGGEHAHTADAPTLVAGFAVVPAGAGHAHEATTPTLTLVFGVVPANAEHGTEATQPLPVGGVLAPWVADTFPTDQDSEITLAVLDGVTTDAGIGAAVRVTGGPSNYAGYALLVSGTGVLSLNRYTDGALDATLYSGTPVALASGDRVKLEARGSTLTARVNDAVVYETTDATLTSGQPAVAGFGSGDTRATATGWKGGNPNKLKHRFAVVTASAEHVHAAGSPSLSTPAEEVVPAGAAHAHTATAPALGAGVALVPASADHGHGATSPALVEAAVLTVNGAAHGTEATVPSLGTAGDVTPASADHGHQAGEPALTEHAVLTAVDGAAHGHTATGPTLGVGVALLPASAVHTHPATAPTLATGVNLTPAAAEHGTAATAPALGVGRPVAPASTEHGTAATSPAVAYVPAVVAASTAHGHTAGEPALTEHAALAGVDAASHTHPATSPQLAVAAQVVPASTAHGHTVTDTGGLSLGIVVVPAAAAHAHEATAAPLGAAVTVVPDSAEHRHTAETIFWRPSTYYGAAAETEYAVVAAVDPYNPVPAAPGGQIAAAGGVTPWATVPPGTIHIEVSGVLTHGEVHP